MKLTFKLLENNKTISNKILAALLPDIKVFFDNSFNKIKQKLPSIIISSIQASPEYSELTNGTLRLELGIPDPNTKVAGLIDIWSKNILYTYNKPAINNTKIKASFSIEMIKADFADVLGSDYAIVVDNIRGYSLPWLEWLLLDGSKTIISNYQVLFGPNPASRTGLAVMVPSSGGWGVSSTYAGTISDNWITRSIDSAETQISNLFDEAFSI
jgi:hypothetical protein